MKNSDFLNNVKVYFANFRDSDEIITVLDEISYTIKAKYPLYSIGSTYVDKLKTIQKLLETDSKIFVAKYNNQIIGIVNLQIIFNIRHGYKRGHIEEIVVEEKYRKKGVGSLLLTKVAEYCNKCNITSIKLNCRKELKEARKFYEENNFKFVDIGYRLENKN